MPPRKDATENVDVLGKPDAVPENQIGDFTESKENNDYFIKAPVWDTVGEGIEEFYVAARVEHHAMLREKAALMEHQEMQAKANESNLREQKQSQDELHEQFFKTNVFLRDFEEKRNAAVKRGQNELAMHEELRSQSANIRSMLEELSAFRDELLATSNEYEPYERVLDDVVTKKRAFGSSKELMDRCDALMLAQAEIVEHGDKKVLELEHMRKRLVAISREAALQVLGLKNALMSVDRFYEGARNEAFKWERVLDRLKSTLIESTANKERVFEGINHLYKILCQRRCKSADLPYEAIEPRLEYIKNEIELLQEVLEAYQKRQTITTTDKGDLMC